MRGTSLLKLIATFIAIAAVSVGLAGAQSPPTKPTSIQPLPNVNIIPCTSAATQKIATGGTSQDLFPASQVIHGFTVQNVDTTEPLCMTFDGTTPACGSAGTFVLPPGAASTFAGAGSFSAPVGFGINVAPKVIAATTNHPYACVKY